jgi:hypothetical protein
VNMASIEHHGGDAGFAASRGVRVLCGCRRAYLGGGDALTGVRRVRVGALVAVLCLGCLSLAWCGSASAGLGHPFLSSFGSFSNVQGIAVDGSGDVYVYDGGAGEVLKFDASGAPEEFSATKTNAISVPGVSNGEGEIAVDSSSGPAKGDIYVAHADGSVLVFSAAGSQIGALTEEAGDPWGEACGVAVDPSGNVYVGLYPEHVNKYVPSASPVTNADYAASIGGVNAPCNVAADSAGNVFADTWSSGPVTRYEAGQFGSLSPTGSVVDKAGSTLAADPSSGELFVDERNIVSEFGAGGEPFEEPLGSFASGGSGAISGSFGIAVSGLNHRVYVSDGKGAISVFGPEVVVPDATTGAASNAQSESVTVSGTVNPSGVALTACKFEYGTTSAYGQSVACAESPAQIGSGSSDVAVHADLSGLTPGSSYHFRLVAENANGSGEGADGTFMLPGPPVVAGEGFSGVSQSEAVVSATVNPTLASTTYHVEYGTSEAYGHTTGESEPVGSDNTAHAVSVTLSGLTAGSTYHYRFVATNSLGVTDGPDATFTTYPTAPTFTPCPNDALRTGVSAHLPDCRAYEQATPVAKDGTDASGSFTTVQASLSGDAVTSVSLSGISGGIGAENFPYYKSARGVSGWVTQGMLTPPSFGTRQKVLGWTPDLAYAFDEVSFNGTIPIEPGLVSNQLSSGGLIQALVPLTDRAKYFFVGSSADDSKIFLEARGSGVNLTGDAATGYDNLYMFDRTKGTLSLVGILPESQGGTAPTEGSFAGSFNWWQGTEEARLAEGGAESEYYTQDEHTVSADGDKAFFTASGSGQIYMRRGLAGSSPETVQVSASQRGTPDPNGAKPAIFMRATPDGSKVFFTSCEKLTNDSTAVSTGENACDTEEQGQDLYVYDTGSGVLTDLTVDSGNPRGADVKGVLGASDDGSYVYFVANGDLDGSGPATSGDCEDSFGNYKGTCSLYVLHDGTATFIARMDTTDSSGSFVSDSVDWAPTTRTAVISNENTSRVSADGLTLLYGTQTGPLCVGGDPCRQFYRYRVGDPAPVCVSCNPSGARSLRAATLTSISTGAIGLEATSILTRNLSADGNRIFFESADKLVAADTNGDLGCPVGNNGGGAIYTCMDVYEWEADGSGSCHSSLENDGCLYLLSSGTSPDAAFFADASVSGDDVFFFTHDSLVPQDRDEIRDIYDARVGGGLASQHPSVLPSCSGEGCQGSPSKEPATPAAASVTFEGPGNAAPENRPSVKVSTRAVRGYSFLMKVIVPSGGRITVSGAGVKSSASSASGAGTYGVRVTLTSKMKKTLARKHHLSLVMRVQFSATGGGLAQAKVVLTVKRPAKARRAGSARSAKSGRGGAR